MSEPTAPPPPPAPSAPAPAPKKGMSTGAKVAIGCLLALALVVGGCFVVSAFFVKKGVDAVKGFAEDVENDPDAAAVKAVELMMKMNPEVEVVSSDPSAGTITLREKKSGKVVTFNAEDLREGRFSFEADGEKVNFDVDETEGDEPGSFSISSSEGKVVFGGDEAAIPGWVPRYPGGTASAFSTVDTQDERSGTFSIRTDDDAMAVLEELERTLEADGFEVRKTTIDSDGSPSGNLTASKGSRTVNVTIGRQQGETQGLVAYSEKKGD